MSAPFFSLLLPTKNRSIIVAEAIQSVFSQTFSDWELIVSDNDDSSTATRDIVARFTDPRIRYFRTSGRLPMHENWEFAFNQSGGLHVLVIEDKQRLNSNALETLHRILLESPDAVITYPVVLTPEESLPPVPAQLVITCNDTRYIVGARPWHEMRPQLLVVQKTGSSWSGWLAVGPNPNK